MAMLLQESWNDERKMELLDNDDGWDTDTDYGDAAIWYPDTEDQAERERRIRYMKRFMETKGFDIDMESPDPGEVELIDFGDAMRFERVKRCACFAIETYNQKLGKNLMLVEIVKAAAWEISRVLITLRVINKFTLEMSTYQTRVLCSVSRRMKCVEIFRPCPIKKDLEYSTVRKRLKLDKDVGRMKEQDEAGDATYAACSNCEKDMYDLISEHARKFKVKFSLCRGPIGLDDPFHRCRIKQSAKVVVARYGEYKNENYRFFTVVEARLNAFSLNQLEYDITFMAFRIPNPLLSRGSSAQSMKFHIRVHYNNIQHGESIEFEMKDVQTTAIIDDDDDF